MIRRCPFCGGEVHLVVKDLLVQAANYAALLPGEAIGKCTECGEEFYTPDTVQRMEALEERLRQGEAGA